MSNRDESDDGAKTHPDSDTVSESSTIVYSHEPFESFKDKVALLITELFPALKAEEIQITRLAGGGFNRIIGISIPQPYSEPSPDTTSLQQSELILRIPRFEGRDLTRQSLTIIHLKKLTSLPIPEILNYDSGCNNGLGEPYILMKRLAGNGLHVVHNAMSHTEKLSMARTIAQVIARIHSSPVPLGYGLLCGSDEGLIICEHTDDNERKLVDCSYAPPPTLTDYLTTRFSEMARKAVDAFNRSIYEGLRDAVADITKLLPSRASYRHVLHHTDFAARNILVEYSAGDGLLWHVSGILDWDECGVSPGEIAFACPGWVWSHPDEGIVSDSFDESNWDPDGPVYNDKCQEIKDAFVDEIEKHLPGFMDVVRETRKVPLKKLWNLAQFGVHSNEAHREATSIVKFASDSK